MHAPLQHLVLRACDPASEIPLLDDIRAHYHSLIVHDSSDDDALLREQLNAAYVRTRALQTMLSSLRADVMAKIPVIDSAAESAAERASLRRVAHAHSAALRRTPSAGSRISAH